MPNAIEELNKLIQRLEMLFQVQTHEVVQDLKRIRDIIETPVVDEPQEEIKQDKQQKLEKVSETTEAVVEITPTITESKEDIVKRYIEKFNKKPFA
jgi:ElaB/YqjD/DUF883 family membrane-anchored ribosome-binding protein